MDPVTRNHRMPVPHQTTYLFASNEPALLEAVEPALLASGAHVEIVLSAEAALAGITASPAPSLVLLDVRLPGMEIGRLLAAVRAKAGSRRFPIVLIADSIAEEWMDRLDEGVIDDLIEPTAKFDYWQLRLQMAMRAHERTRELEMLREAVAVHAQTDPLTGVYNRSTLLSMLFRETDRVQRMNTSLCMMLFDIDDFGHWNARLGSAACDDLMVQAVGRVTRLLRSYDLFGRVGKDEFLVALPGCSAVNALLLAERVRLDVFSAPFHLGGQAIRLSACFAVVDSHGRSPVVVLREAEQVLRAAQEAGPEQIKCSGDCPEPHAPPVGFLSGASVDDLLAW